MIGGGCWIFLSHSSHDIEKVRVVRNEFERLGHNPLAFYLRCLNDDTEEGKHEIDDLIKREIDARDWFVFCDSPDAEKSPYVQEEQSYIINSGKDKIWTIDMTKDIDFILHKVQEICIDIEVFVSYSHSDSQIVMPLIKALIDQDYSVWYGVEELGENWMDSIITHTNNCTRKGFFVSVITDEYVASENSIAELYHAVKQGARIIPVIIGSPQIPDRIQSIINSYQDMFVRLETLDYTPVLDKLNSEVKKKLF